MEFIHFIQLWVLVVVFSSNLFHITPRYFPNSDRSTIKMVNALFLAQMKCFLVSLVNPTNY